MSEPVYIHPAEARRRFTEFAGGEITNDNLALGALLIALEDHPDLNVDARLLQLEQLVKRIRARCNAGEPPVFRLGHLHAEMFDVEGYSGDAENYYDPRNAYLDDVMDRKRGLPIVLSIVFLHVANRIGLNAAGVGLPGHYIVKVQFELNEVYVDPFRGGETLSVREIEAIVRETTGGTARLSSDHLRAWGGRETLMRVLTNLHSMWLRAGDSRKAAAAGERLALLQT